MHAIVTGAGGFVGRALCAALGPGNWARLGLREPGWEAALEATPFEGAVVFHLAARVHEASGAEDAAFEYDNALKTRRLAQAAVRAGARRIVFLSTIKVHGEETHAAPFRPDDTPAPQDAYARSKLAAESALREVAGAGGVEWVVVRPPLVLGPGAHGNLPSLLRLCDNGLPLPFGAIANRRSMIHREDLARLLLTCATHPAAPDATWLAAHPQPVATPDLFRVLRAALGRPARLAPVPATLLELAAAVAGQGERIRRLTRSLEVDASQTLSRLDWQPRVTLEAACAEMARAWREGWQ